MTMDIERLLSDYNISYITEGHKHCTDGWVNIHCPFCAGSQNFHLGISTEHGGSHCWRCGGHSALKVLSKVLGVTFPAAGKIIRQYESGGRRRIAQEVKVSIHPFKYPTPNRALTTPYKNYLIQRGFDPDKLEKEWGVFQTGPISFLDGINYSHRILIPIYWNGEIVSFQARGITKKSDLKYLACPKRREKIHHKNILYGKPAKLSSLKAIIIVEGVTDVWRFGSCAAATFGIEFKMEQVLQLSKFDAEFFIIFDDGKDEQVQAKKLATKLRTLGKRAHVISGIQDDPGAMKQSEADYFVNNLLK